MGSTDHDHHQGDKYRSYLYGDEHKDVHWRHGGPPIYDLVNELFQQGQTNVWPEGSLEETVQNAIKTWEMELSHKTRLQDFKTINPEKFKLFVNGREGLSGKEVLKLGSYNALLKTSLPEEFEYYFFFGKALHLLMTYSRGFAWEVIKVYSGPPLIAFKFRHKIYYDPGELFEGLLKGPKIDSSNSSQEEHEKSTPSTSAQGCPFYKED
ncbi:hypothetical protein MKW92_039942 [Papaver armeniacum]|nr:hypothetical protein MKW92_039942 [Papaver armeniacum]